MIPSAALIIAVSLARSISAQCVCGRDNRRRKIIGGSNTEVNEYPWMAAIVDRRFAPEPDCGGALINSNHVLTAAHCMDGRSTSSVLVVLGDHNWRKENEADERTYRVQRIIRHPSYNTRTLDYDVAILKLRGHTRTYPHIRPICLPTSSVPAGRWMTAAGWGVKDEDGDTAASNLKEIRLQQISKKSCRIKLSGEAVTQSMVCAAADNVGTCYGDSGGPLMAKNGGVWELHGLTSWGVACRDVPGVYAAVQHVKSWITQNIGSECQRAG